MPDLYPSDAKSPDRYQPCPAPGCGEPVDTWLAGTTAAHTTPKGVMNEATPLTEDELLALADGTEIVITWSGGNGPHRGIVFVERGQPYYVPRHEDPHGPLRHYNPITFVGPASPFTRVWLAEAYNGGSSS